MWLGRDIYPQETLFLCSWKECATSGLSFSPVARVHCVVRVRSAIGTYVPFESLLQVYYRTFINKKLLSVCCLPDTRTKLALILCLWLFIKHFIYVLYAVKIKKIIWEFICWQARTRNASVSVKECRLDWFFHLTNVLFNFVLYQISIKLSENIVSV